jgi:putative flippase GtrA
MKTSKYNFVIVGGIGFLIDYILFSALSAEFGFLVSRVLSFSVSTGFCWLGNRRFTFDKSKMASSTIEGSAYYTVSTIAAIVNIWLSLFLINLLSIEFSFFALGISCALAAALNYSLLQKFVYARK